MTYFARRLIPLAAFVLLAWTAPAGAQATACTDCHSDVAVHSPVHSKLACADCHTTVKADEDHAEAAKKEIASPGFCSTCHADVDLSHSVHKEVSCARCHGKAHDVVPVKDPKSPVAARNQVQTCVQCHSSASIKAYRNSVHGRALFDAGLVSAPSCTTCHGSHDIVKASDPARDLRHLPHLRPRRLAAELSRQGLEPRPGERQRTHLRDLPRLARHPPSAVRGGPAEASGNLLAVKR